MAERTDLWVKFLLPVALSLAGTVAVGVWVAGHRDATIDDHERRIVKLEDGSKNQAASDSLLARIDERTLFIVKALAEAREDRRGGK